MHEAADLLLIWLEIPPKRGQDKSNIKTDKIVLNPDEKIIFKNWHMKSRILCFSIKDIMQVICRTNRL